MTPLRRSLLIAAAVIGVVAALTSLVLAGWDAQRTSSTTAQIVTVPTPTSITCAPQAPQAQVPAVPTASVTGSGQVTVNWSAIATTPGAVVSLPAKAGSGVGASVKERQIRTGGGTVVATVGATNSTTTGVVPPANLTSATTNFSVRNISYNQNWTSAAATVGCPQPAVSYLVEAVNASNQAVGNCTTTGTSCAISGLTGGTSYTYRVTPRNGAVAGPARSSSAVTACATPGAPTIGTSTVQNGQLVVNWSAPGSNGGCTVSNYRVQVFNSTGGTATGVTGDLTRVTGSTATSYTFTGLTNGTTYRFAVEATNASGAWSTASSLSTGAIPLGPASAPTFAGVYGSSSTSLSWTFTVPSDNGGSAISRYEYTTNGGTNWATLPTLGTLASITTTSAGANLAGGTTYTISFRAMTDGGNLAGTVSAVQTLTTAYATGGTYSQYTSGGTLYGVHTFTHSGTSNTTGTLTVHTARTMDYLILSGGGSGGLNGGGGGGGGGVATGATSVTSGAKTIDIGGGGSAAFTSTVGGVTYQVRGNRGGSSAFNSITVQGGGWASNRDPGNVNPCVVSPCNFAAMNQNDENPRPSTGGGGSNATTGDEGWAIFRAIGADGVTTPLRGYDGGDGSSYLCQSGGFWGDCGAVGGGGGGGGAGGVGGNAGITTVNNTTATVGGSGGAGRTSSITGTTATYGGGGGGGKTVWGRGGVSGSGGGGNSRTNGEQNGTDGLGGGGAGNSANVAGTGRGGAGRVIVRYSIPVGTPQAAPTITSVTPGDSQVTFSFSPPSGVSATNYQYSLDGGENWTTRSPGSTSSPWTISGLTNGQTYDLAIRALVGATPGSASGVETFSPLTTPATVNLTAADRSASQTITLSFEAPSDGGSPILDYTVRRATNSEFSANLVTTSNLDPDCIPGLPPVTCQLTFDGLTNGTTYWFEVKARNAAGLSATWSTTRSAFPYTTPSTPAAPNSLTPGNNQVTVGWVAPANGGSLITGYLVTASPGGATCTTTNPNSSTPAPTTCVVSGLNNGDAYTFTVRASNAAGNSGTSSASASATPRTVPAAITNLSAGRTASQTITLSFTRPSNGGSEILDYTVRRATNSGFSANLVTTDNVTASCTGSACTIPIEGLTNGTTYWFEVKARNVAGEAATWSTPEASAFPFTTPATPSAPTTLTPGNTQVTVGWSAPDNGGSLITGYLVTAAPGGATCTTTNPNSSTPAPTTCTVSGLTNGDAYTFTVRASNAAGNSGTSGASASATPTAGATAPAAPTITGIARGVRELSVSFTAPSTTGGASISNYEYSFDGTTWVAFDPAITIQTGSTTATVPNTATLSDNTNYDVYLRARNSVGAGAASTAGNATTAGVPATPSAPAVTTNGARCDVSWSAPSANGSAITSYELERNDGSGWTLVDTVTGTSFSDEGLSSGTYTYRVAATNGVGTGTASAASATCNPVESSTAVPRNVQAFPAPTAIRVTWDAPIDGEPDDYLVTYATGIGGEPSEPIVVDGAETEVTINDLVMGAVYFVSVAAEVDSVENPADEMLVQTTLATFLPTTADPGTLAFSSDHLLIPMPSGYLDTTIYTEVAVLTGTLSKLSGDGDVTFPGGAMGDDIVLTAPASGSVHFVAYGLPGFGWVDAAAIGEIPNPANDDTLTAVQVLTGLSGSVDPAGVLSLTAYAQLDDFVAVQLDLLDVLGGLGVDPVVVAIATPVEIDEVPYGGQLSLAAAGSQNLAAIGGSGSLPWLTGSYSGQILGFDSLSDDVIAMTDTSVVDGVFTITGDMEDPAIATYFGTPVLPVTGGTLAEIPATSVGAVEAAQVGDNGFFGVYVIPDLPEAGLSVLIPGDLGTESLAVDAGIVVDGSLTLDATGGGLGTMRLAGTRELSPVGTDPTQGIGVAFGFAGDMWTYPAWVAEDPAVGSATDATGAIALWSYDDSAYTLLRPPVVAPAEELVFTGLVLADQLTSYDPVQDADVVNDVAVVGYDGSTNPWSGRLVDDGTAFAAGVPAWDGLPPANGTGNGLVTDIGGPVGGQIGGPVMSGIAVGPLTGTYPDRDPEAAAQSGPVWMSAAEDFAIAPYLVRPLVYPRYVGEDYTFTDLPLVGNPDPGDGVCLDVGFYAGLLGGSAWFAGADVPGSDPAEPFTDYLCYPAEGDDGPFGELIWDSGSSSYTWVPSDSLLYAWVYLQINTQMLTESYRADQFGAGPNMFFSAMLRAAWAADSPLEPTGVGEPMELELRGTEPIGFSGEASFLLTTAYEIVVRLPDDDPAVVVEELEFTDDPNDSGATVGAGDLCDNPDIECTTATTGLSLAASTSNAGLLDDYTHVRVRYNDGPGAWVALRPLDSTILTWFVLTLFPSS